MTAAQNERRAAVVEVSEEPTPSLYLARVLDEIERANAQREEGVKRPTPTPERAPHPFAYD